jgi:hypothetical protein
MNELFRFSVIRPAERSDAVTATLQRPPDNLSMVPPGWFHLQDELRKIVEKTESDQPPPLGIWVRFEEVALLFVQRFADSILADPLWASLDAFLVALQEAVDAWGEASSTNSITVLFAQAPPLSDDTLAFHSALADLFLALMIIRRGGPAHLDEITRSGRLWDQAELLSSKPSLLEIANRIRAIDLLAAGASSIIPASASSPAEMQAALREALATATNLTLLLPPEIFCWLAKPVHGVGFREFHVVKQHIRRYDLVEIGRIENVLKGESRSHRLKHTLSNETDTLFQTDTTTETEKELSTKDHVAIQNEATDQVKEDTKVDAGVHASYDGGSYKLAADLTVSYAKSSEHTKKFSSDVAKDVTQRASTKVTERVTQSQTRKVIETFADSEKHRFENTSGSGNGSGHISGVYQWVEKVYLAQVFNLGRHMLVDLMVPEPAANLLGLENAPSVDPSKPLPPPPLKWLSWPEGAGKPPRPVDLGDDLETLQAEGATVHELSPTDLQPDELDTPPDPGIPYVQWIARYDATGVAASPPRFASAGKSITRNAEGDLAAEDEIRLADGYEALTAHVELGWKHAKGDDETGVATVQIGASKIVATEGTPQPGSGVLQAVEPSDSGGSSNQKSYYLDRVIYKDLTADTHESTDKPSPIVGSVPLGVSAPNISQVSVTVELQCRRLPSLLRQWQLQTFEKIVTAYRQLESDYESKLAARQFRPAPAGVLGAADPAANRLTERLELKRSCIAILDNDNATVRGMEPNVAVQPFPTTRPTDSDDPNYPQLDEPKLRIAQALGARVRWFEQAFEWQNMAYVLYPYFWARRQTWIDRAHLKSDDPLFIDFLKAGYARVVVPVRRGFEPAVCFYLCTGLPWLGGDLPPIGDRTQSPLYLDIAEEIKALTGGGTTGETETPVGEPWEYSLPTTLIKLRDDDGLPEWHRIGPDGKENPDYPSDPPPDTWTWRNGKPITSG